MRASRMVARHDCPMTRPAPAENEGRDRALHAARRLPERRDGLVRTSNFELIRPIHEGHRY